MQPASAVPHPAPLERWRVAAPRVRPRECLGLGITVAYLSLVALLPLAALVWRAAEGGGASFWRSATSPQALAALGLTLLAATLVVATNVVTGTLIAWVLVRDRFPGQGVVNALVDLPFALPTVIAGLTLLSLYGPRSPVGLNLAYSQAGVVLALLFVTLPFVVRSAQPVLLELDREMEDAAVVLGASGAVVFRRILLPNLWPAILSGAALAFARAMGEFGSVVLLSGNIPFQTEVAAVYIFAKVESGRLGEAAAVSVVLLGIAFLVLFVLTLLQRWGAARED